MSDDDLEGLIRSYWLRIAPSEGQLCGSLGHEHNYLETYLAQVLPAAAEVEDHNVE